MSTKTTVYCTTVNKNYLLHYHVGRAREMVKKCINHANKRFRLNVANANACVTIIRDDMSKLLTAKTYRFWFDT